MCLTVYETLPLYHRLCSLKRFSKSFIEVLVSFLKNGKKSDTFQDLVQMQIELSVAILSE